MDEDRDPNHFTNKRISTLNIEDDFQSWKQQVLFAVGGYNLDGHLDGTRIVQPELPPPADAPPDAPPVPNPEYARFKQLDNALSSWLLASIGQQIRRYLIGCTTAAEIWAKLARLFSSTSTTRIMSLYDRLKVPKRFNQDMKDYLADIQSAVDGLASCGNPVGEMQHVSTILSGVKGQFENVVTVIHAGQITNLAAVSSILLDAEARQAASMFDSQISLNVAAMFPTGLSGSSSSCSGSSSSGHVGSSKEMSSMTQAPTTITPTASNVQYAHPPVMNPLPPANNAQYANAPVMNPLPPAPIPAPPIQQPPPQAVNMPYNPPGAGRGQGQGRGRNRLQCQLCGRNGHPVSRCWYRFDPNFQGPPSGPRGPAPPAVNYLNYDEQDQAPPYHAPAPQPLPFVQPMQNPFPQAYGGYSLMPLPTTPGAPMQFQVVPSNSPQAQYQSSHPQANLAAAQTSGSNTAWFPDSGATHHVTNTAQSLSSSVPYRGNGKVTTANGSSLNISDIGHSSIYTDNRLLMLSNVLYAPLVTKNLISVSQFTKDNQVYFEFHPTHCVIKDSSSHKELLRGPVSGGLYQLDLHDFNKQEFLASQLQKAVPSLLLNASPEFNEPATSSSVNNQSLYSFYDDISLGLGCQLSPDESVELSECLSVSASVPIETWHQRLGHPSLTTLSALIKKHSLSNLSLNSFSDKCVACSVGKSHALPFSDSTTVYSHPLELLELDLWGPAPFTSSGLCYYLSIVDAYSRYTWVYFLKKKSDTAHVFSVFHKLAETQLGYTIKAVQTDGGGEFKALTPYFASAGIQHRLTCPYTSAQNGIVERKHRHIVEMGLTLLSQSNMPLHYWVDAFYTAAYLINRLPTPVLNNVSPYEMIFQKTPDYHFLKTFGCLCFPHLRPYRKHKLDFRSEQCVFLGYSPSHKGYKCMNAEGRIYISRHVVFHENVFPFADKNGPFIQSQSVKNSSYSNFFLPDSSFFSNFTPITSISEPSSSYTAGSSEQDPAISHSFGASDTSLELPSVSSPVATPLVNPEAQNQDSATSPSPAVQHPMITRSKSAPTLPTEPPLSTTNHPMITRSKAQATDAHFEALTIAIGGELLEPTSIHQAMKHSHWQLAVNEELSALITNSTWSLVPPPEGRIPIGCKWIFKVKRNPDGSVLRYKARLVAKGFSQQPGFDFQDTFSPVVKPQTVRVILTLAISNHWNLRQIDINNAFLHGDLTNDIYMVQPPGFEQRDSQGRLLVCKLHKALYGLKQAPRAWFEKFKTFLVNNLGFKAAVTDSCLFIKETILGAIYLLVYVDDIVITGSDTRGIEDTILHINQTFSLKDLGKLNYFLGMEVERVDDFLLLTQKKYISELIEKVGLPSNSSPVSTPMVGTVTSSSGKNLFLDTHLYRQTVGSLQYMCVTRPDIAFSVNKLSQCVESPTEANWYAVLRVLKYLKSTLTHGLVFKTTSVPSPSVSLIAFCDADWGNNTTDRRSMTGYTIFLNDNPVSWTSKKQQVVSRSTAEAEYRSIADTMAELIWVTNLLSELNVKLTSTPVLWSDNTSAITFSENPVHHSKTKHFEVGLAWVREKVKSGQVVINYVPADSQVADILTKPLTQKKFLPLRYKLGVASRTELINGTLDVHFESEEEEDTVPTSTHKGQAPSSSHH